MQIIEPKMYPVFNMFIWINQSFTDVCWAVILCHDKGINRCRALCGQLVSITHQHIPNRVTSENTCGSEKCKGLVIYTPFRTF